MTFWGGMRLLRLIHGSYEPNPHYYAHWFCILCFFHHWYFAPHPVTEVSYIQLCQQHIPLLNALSSSSPLPYSLVPLPVLQFPALTMMPFFPPEVLNPHLTSFAPQLLLRFPFICKFTQCAVSGAPLLTPFLSNSPTTLWQPSLKYSWTFQTPFGATVHPWAPCAGCSQPSCGQGDSPFWSHPSFVPISVSTPYSLISSAGEILCRAFLVSKSFTIAFQSCLLSSSYLRYSHL